jgi:hypothetical protein
MNWFLKIAALTVLAGIQAALAEIPVKGPNFSRDIRPILSENCFACHGPDEKARKAKLRLDTKEGAFAEIDGKPVIVAGESGKSELVRRITTADPEDKMPPEKSGKHLSEQQIDLLKHWVDSGAKWELHWAFEKPVRPPLPEVRHKDWPQNPIDYFTLAKMEQEGLAPSPQADKRTLVRRSTLDLTGLPPTIDEVDSFLADNTKGSYDTLVDRLIDSSHYGEQTARYWLDAARYADSHGYHIDSPRMVWKYREWVIDAFNKNMPFDEFTIDQLAGDMLPNARTDQIVASGFNRCNMTTGEGGAIDEEYRVKYAADRVETLSMVWMGLTMGCCQCHSHKFDPMTQKEFYQMAAFFNGIAENAMDGNAPAPPPSIKVPTKEQSEEMGKFDKEIAAFKEKLDGPNSELDAAQARWETEWRDKLKTDWAVLDPIESKSKGGASFKKLEDHSYLVEGTNSDKETYEFVYRVGPAPVSGLRLEALIDDSLHSKGPGRSDNGNFVLSEFQVDAAPITQPDKRQRIRFSSAFADYSQEKFPVANAIDGKNETGWGIDGMNKHESRSAVFIPEHPITFAGGTELRVRLVFETQFAKHTIGRVRVAVAHEGEGLRMLTPPMFTSWQMVGPFTAGSGEEAFNKDFGPEKQVDLTQSWNDAKLKWVAKPDFADGKANNLSGDNAATYLYRTITVPQPRKLTLSFGSDDAIKVWLNGKAVLEKNVQRGVEPDQDKVTVDLNAGENQLLVKAVNYSGAYAFYFKPGAADAHEITPEIAQSLVLSGGTVSDAQKSELRKFYRKNFSPGWQELADQLKKVEDQKKTLDGQIAMCMVSKELDTPRDTYLLIRGEYDHRGEKVLPGVPSILPPLPHSEKTNRLALAKWLVDKNNPLTARVTVNRFWQRYFGTGLVKTTEDFGAQGEQPTHPELLDWLAVEFMESGWDVKHIQKLMVTSATYKQSSKLTPDLLQKDSLNKFYARGPRFRMDAEMIRDNALAVSGLLVDKIGGPSVKPYQPPGLWTEVSYGFKEDYVPDKGEGLYRRSMYTYWKRQSPPPGMTTFDAPSREVCTVRRPRTNTPLQALALMNDPQYVEASRALATRMIKQGSADVEQRIDFGFRLATARPPSEKEKEVLLSVYKEQLAQYSANKEAATKLLSVGESKPDPAIDTAELAAWTSVASMILNLDATITKS